MLLKTQYPKEMRKIIRPGWAQNRYQEVTIVTPGKALALATPSSHYPEERSYPNLTSLSHIPGHLPLLCATYRDRWSCQGQKLSVPSPAPNPINPCPLGIWVSQPYPASLLTSYLYKRPSCHLLLWKEPFSMLEADPAQAHLPVSCPLYSVHQIQDACAACGSRQLTLSGLLP